MIPTICTKEISLSSSVSTNISGHCEVFAENEAYHMAVRNLHENLVYCRKYPLHWNRSEEHLCIRHPVLIAAYDIGHGRLALHERGPQRHSYVRGSVTEVARVIESRNATRLDFNPRRVLGGA